MKKRLYDLGEILEENIVFQFLGTLAAAATPFLVLLIMRAIL